VLGMSMVALSGAWGQTMYFTDYGHDHISRADLDGSNIVQLVTKAADGIEDPTGIALDVAGGKMYFTDNGNDDISRADLDGSNIVVLVTGLDGPTGIALDVAGGKMYWSDGGTVNGVVDAVWRADLNGSNVTCMTPDQGSQLTGIALDLPAAEPVLPAGTTIMAK